MERTTLTVDEAASYLGISKWLLQKLYSQNKIPHIRAGGRVLFRIDSIDNWMVAKEVDSVGKPVQEQYGRLRRIAE